MSSHQSFALNISKDQGVFFFNEQTEAGNSSAMSILKFATRCANASAFFCGTFLLLLLLCFH